MKILVTAGPTREPIDPVRFLSNRSSGKMGYALAAAARDAGHDVILVSGPTSLPSPAGVETVRVTTAAEMLDAVSARFDDCDALIMAAAVADYTPAEAAPQKIKKGAAEWSLRLVATTDILAAMSLRKKRQRLVGFAAESRDLLSEARRKLSAKRCDLLVANDILGADAGFDTDTNRVVLLHADGREEAWPLLAKSDVARRVIAALESVS